MIIYFLIWSLHMTNCFILQNSYNDQLQNSAHYKIDETFRKSDLKMIEKHNLPRSNIDKRKKVLHELNNHTSKAYNRRSSKILFKKTTEDIVPEGTTSKVRLYRGSRATRKSEVHTSSLNGHHDENMNRKQDKQYDYDENLQEYYDEMLWEERQNDTYHPSPAQHDLMYYIKKVTSYDKESNTSSALSGLTELQRLVVDYKEKFTREELAARTWKMFRICVIVYLAVAVPLWCTKGWCCCCLCCRICKPRRTIMKAKNYLVQNPPGMLKNRKGHTLYEPTQEERKTYLEFEHLIRII